MAEEHGLTELINQAISCEHPHVYGTVNLNRLREILCLLVQAQAPYEAPNTHDWSESFEKDCEIERSFSEAAVNSDSLQNVADPGPTGEQDGIEHGSNVNITPSRPLSTTDREQSVDEACQNVLFDISEIVQKLNEIDERLRTIETRSIPLECARVSNSGAPEEDKNVSPSTQNILSNSEQIPESSIATQINATEKSFDVEQSETLNNTDALVMSREASPAEEVADGNSVHKTKKPDQSLGASGKNIKDSTQHPTLPSVEEAFKKHDEKGEDFHHADDEKSTLPATNSVEKVEKVTSGGNVFTAKFEQLVAIVVGLVERDKMFSERLSEVEKMLTTYTDKLHNSLKETDCNQPLSLDSIKVNIIDQDTNQDSQGAQKTVPETVANNTNFANETLANVQSKVNEIENEMCFLRAMLKNLNIAAGGTIPTEASKHVQCISCNCTAVMEVFETPIPKPMPFHVKRCMKPFLRSQLDSLRKELKHSAVVPLDMEPYWKLLKKPKLCQLK